MDIQTAYRLTKTDNKKELAAALGFEGPSAVYQWDEDEIPVTSEKRILKLAGLYPSDEAIEAAVGGLCENDV